ncbi:cytochrome b/b6 domain-containing protein [Duganella sp. Root1480D1]|uniref:cytochrome b/b6 domain-containing protein n=1 Tax=Duganella sp. Root1480D1 TaxID=1736471 RepID=UPI0009E87BB1|nr:cytochrome b/b6 domain-containing protein [Duganella sp. Root1480D1]
MLESKQNKQASTGASILVWDVPVRVFHWLMALCFAGAYLTAESEQWRLVHVTLGYTMAGLIAFRLVWGLIGSRYARFGQFVRGPAAVAGYLRSLLHGKPQHFLGHNPAGALAILGLLALGAATTATGWAAFQESSAELWEEVHETFANLMLALVLLHIAAVIASSRLHHENLVASMFNGEKAGQPDQGIRRGWHSIGLLVLLGVAAFWWLQWKMS